jgi:ATPase subunit of ABC transporter with duplicated ATPase domains
VGHIEAMAVEHRLPDGRTLFSDVSFRVGDGAKVALVGPNGAGKTTLLRMVAGELTPVSGNIARAPGWPVSSKRVHRRRSRATRTCGCGCAGPAPASGPSCASSWSSTG